MIDYAQRALFKHLKKWYNDHRESPRDILKRLKRHHHHHTHEVR